MGILARVKSMIKGNDNPKEENNNDSKMTEQIPVSLDHLVSSLDEAALTLAKSSIDDERKSRYAQMLIDMKNEISGIPEAKAIPALPDAMSKMLSEALPKALKYGSAEDVEEVRKAAFESIRVLPGTVKEQQTATLNMDIQLMKCEIIEGEYWCSISIKESEELFQRKSQNRDDKEARASFERVEKLIDVLTARNKRAQEKIAELAAYKRDIERDALGTGFLSAHDMIESFLKTLPSIEKQLEAVQKIEEIGDRALAKLRSDTNVLAQVLGSKSEEELDKRVLERRNQKDGENGRVAGEGAQPEAAEQEPVDAQMEATQE